jgi:hypothetical protein
VRVGEIQQCCLYPDQFAHAFKYWDAVQITTSISDIDKPKAMDLTDLLAATKDVNAAITQIDQKLRKPSSTPAVVEQATTDAKEELGDVAHVSGHGYVASHRCLAVARPSNSIELVDLVGGASTVLMEAPSQAAVAACAHGTGVLVVAAWGDACARWHLARDGTGGWRVVAPRKTFAGLAAAGTILVAVTSDSYIARCAGTVVQVLNEHLVEPVVAHFSVGGAGRALAWDPSGEALAVAGAGGLTIWGSRSEPETVIPTPCRCVVATKGSSGYAEDDAFVCVADAGLLTREEARADDMKARASDGYVGRAETRDTGFGGGLIPAGLLVGGGAAAAPPEALRPTASLVTWDMTSDVGQWRVAYTARIDALPRGVAVVDAAAAVGDAVALASSFDPQGAVAVFAAADLAPRPTVGLGGGRVRALAADGGRLAAVVVARTGAPPLCAAGARGPAPGAARRVVVDLAPWAPPAPPPPAPPAPPAAPSSVTDRLATLATLRASGALTDAEFARAKALELGLPAP